MNFQNVDPGTLIFIALGIGLLCVVGIGLILALQFAGNIIGTLFSFFNLFFDVVSGGPIAWCGCLLLIGACGLCGGIAYLAAVCSGGSAMNFCLLFGQ